MEDKKCCESYGKKIGVILIPETPFEKGMSISTWQEKRAENAQEILDNIKEKVENGNAIVIKSKNPTD